MKIEINYQPSQDNFSWVLYTGPDGADEYRGTGTTLGQCFEEILVKEVLNAIHYTNDQL